MWFDIGFLILGLLLLLLSLGALSVWVKIDLKSLLDLLIE